MFESKTAWFSASCHISARKLWVDNGGKLEDVSLALYIFSDNWEQEDTKILYDSEAYLKQNLAVFSSKYVIDAVHQGIDHVLLWKYFLIPPCIKNNIDMRGIQSTTELRHQKNIAHPASKHVQHAPLPGTRSTNVQKENSTDSSSSPYLSSTSSSTDVSSPEKSQSLVHSVRNQDTRKVSANQMTVNKFVSPASVSSSTQHGNRYREINTVDIDSIPHIQSLPKVISCLRTIYPGKDGVEVKHVT